MDYDAMSGKKEIMLETLRKPFDKVYKRQGAGNQTFDYIPHGDVLDRVLEATLGDYDWELVSIQLINQESASRKTGEVKKHTLWMAHGRLTIRGLGTKDGVGTAEVETADSAKAAETDAFKRAAVKFGVALHLYQIPPKEESRSSTPPPAGGGQRVNEGAAPCPSCNAPAGKMHGSACTHP